MRLTTAAKNLMLDALDETQASGAKFGSLHSAYSATGANELSGGTTPYARKAATWDAAGAPTAGAKQTAAASPMVFDVPAGAQVRFVGFWNLGAGGTASNFLGMSPNGGGVPQAFVVPTIANDTLECAAHGFVANDAVVVWAVPGDPLPTGLTEGNVYFVSATGLSTDHLQLSAASGGATIDLTAIGAGFLQKVVIETFGGQGTHTVTSVTMTMD